jgi:hypothetical protein
MSSGPRTNNDTGETVTIVDQNHHNRQPKAAPRAVDASHDLAREHGNHVALLADVTEDCIAEVDLELGARTQYEDGLQVLRFLIGAEWSERVLELDQVLHDERGSFSAQKAVEFIDLLLAGRSSMQARQEMLARQPRRADRARLRREAVASARGVSSNLHSLAEATERPAPHAPQAPARPALPSAAAPAPVQAELPHREPIAPSLPPLFPPAPEEKPTEQTGTLVALVKDASKAGTLSVQSVQRLHDEGFGQRPAAAAPVFGPAPDPGFAASALPGRIGDTITMRADEVLAGLAADDASKVDADAPALPPFVRAASAAESRSSGAAGKGDGDDAGS